MGVLLQPACEVRHADTAAVERHGLRPRFECRRQRNGAAIAWQVIRAAPEHACQDGEVLRSGPCVSRPAHNAGLWAGRSDDLQLIRLTCPSTFALQEEDAP